MRENITTLKHYHCQEVNVLSDDVGPTSEVHNLYCTSV